MSLYAFNGTWNAEKTDIEKTEANEYDSNTSVLKFRDAYTGPKHYTNGVGTRFGFFGRFAGGAFGIGGQDRINDALDELRKRLAAGDRHIDIIGFSRGAALALAFANRLTKRVVDPVTSKPPHIRFLGLWDVVGAFGIPINLGPIKFQEYNVGYKMDVPSNVEYCCHALALDERRQTFRPTRLKGAYEVWFRGAHSDVGGGNDNLGLNNIAFCWMLQADSAGWPRSAATDLAWRPRARDEATRSGRLPRLVRLGLWCSCGSRRGRLGRSSSRFCCGLGPCGSRLCVVLLETAMFVFAARAAMTGLVAPRSCTGRSSH